MSERMIDLTCKEFTEKLSSDSPTPGGASVAALVGAFANALGQMAGNLSLSKKEDEEKENLKGLLNQADLLQNDLLELIDEDKKCFQILLSAYKLPKSDEKPSKIQEGILTAIKPPIKILEKTCEAVDLIEQITPYTKKMLLSDVACAAILAKSAIDCALVNILVNSSSITDNNKKQEINNRADKLFNKYIEKADKIAEEIKKELR